MQNVPFLVRWKQAWITGGVHLSRAAVKPDTLPSMRVSTICGANLCSPLSPLLFHSHPPLSPPSFPHPPWVEPTLRGCALPISVSHLSLWVTGAGICWVWNWPSHFCPWTFQAPPSSLLAQTYNHPPTGTEMLLWPKVDLYGMATLCGRGKEAREWYKYK